MKIKINPFPSKPWILCVCSKKLFENAVEKRKKIAPFSTVFSTHLGNFILFSSNLKLSSENSVSLKESKDCCFGMNCVVKV